MDLNGRALDPRVTLCRGVNLLASTALDVPAEARDFDLQSPERDGLAAAPSGSLHRARSLPWRQLLLEFFGRAQEHQVAQAKGANAQDARAVSTCGRPSGQWPQA